MGSPSRNHKKHKHEKSGHSHDRHKDHEYRRRSRSRSISPEYKRRVSPSRGRKEERRFHSRSRSPIDRYKDYNRREAHRPLSNHPLASKDDNLTKEEKDMKRIMGFANFDTTKGQRVEGNDVGDVHVILKRKYRQYMNRKGGFNRPLDFVA